ncbi:hypothetical protein B0T13DRAFT_83161 [Neurospora crassa]|nr:hypothetical protein B0T13DRAFT_83161 [Neurospora crassa]
MLPCCLVFHPCYSPQSMAESRSSLKDDPIVVTHCHHSFMLRYLPSHPGPDQVPTISYCSHQWIPILVHPHVEASPGYVCSIPGGGQLDTVCRIYISLHAFPSAGCAFPSSTRYFVAVLFLRISPFGTFPLLLACPVWYLFPFRTCYYTFLSTVFLVSHYLLYTA